MTKSVDICKCRIVRDRSMTYDSISDCAMPTTCFGFVHPLLIRRMELLEYLSGKELVLSHEPFLTAFFVSPPQVKEDFSPVVSSNRQDICRIMDRLVDIRIPVVPDHDLCERSLLLVSYVQIRLLFYPLEPFYELILLRYVLIVFDLRQSKD